MFGLLAGCGGAVPPSEVPAAEPTAALGPLDLPRLLPVQTQGVAHVDMDRLRNSPHYDAVVPHLRRLLDEVEDDATQRQLEDLIGQTDSVVLGMLPDGVVILATGRYAPDVVGRLAGTSASRAVATVRGHRVLESVDPDDADAPSLAQVRPDTLVLAAPAEAMDFLLARVDAPPTTGERWPSRVRDNVAETRIEDATLGFALGQSAMEDEPFTFSGRADVDGPLQVEIRLHTQREFARIASTTVEALLMGMANEGAGEHPVLARLPQLTRTEVQGDSVVVSVESDASTAEDLVPALLHLLVQAIGGSSEDEPAEAASEFEPPPE